MWKESEVRNVDAEIGWYVTRLTFYYAWSSSRLDQRNREHPVRHRVHSNMLMLSQEICLFRFNAGCHLLILA